MTMASLWKHPNSPFWTACYTNSLGRQVKRSTKQRNAKLARKIAEAWEEAEAKGRARQMTVVQIQKFASDLESFKLHPALLDFATGYAMNLIEGYDAESLWVPISYRKLRYYAPLTRSILPR